ncbi:MAG: glycosyltransferase [Solirubrobacteraceae bacterium]
MQIVVYVDHFPALSETFVVGEVAALRAAGHEVRVETGRWATEPAELDDPPPVTCLADDGLGRRGADLAWLVTRYPWAVLTDLRQRRAWRASEPVHPLRVLAPIMRRMARAGERHIHVHFASGAALDALRMTAFMGTTYSVVAHAFEIYRRPANLGEKLRGAEVAFGVCEATVRDLRDIAGRQANVRLLAMGVDAERFSRRSPVPGGRHVLAVGRLVEKKGFADLVAATALLRGVGAALDRVTIVGDGPLRETLERQAAELGVDDLVQFAGARQPDDVVAFLDSADLLAVPSVVAADGDRDALPVVVGEALAMEVPVVVSDVAGLPEVVRPEWGRVVPAGDRERLAEAIAELLALPVAERIAMGRAARAWVVTERDRDRWARRLVEMLAEAGIR